MLGIPFVKEKAFLSGFLEILLGLLRPYVSIEVTSGAGSASYRFPNGQADGGCRALNY